MRLGILHQTTLSILQADTYITDKQSIRFANGGEYIKPLKQWTLSSNILNL